ncbi:MAG: hypothetical protein HY619_01460 [Thaumarchaeota archaeon]|nr:hypothetical protein [Nitrososphaerota archaeon]
MMKIGEATKRRIPRFFSFHWGAGEVVEEASIKCNFNKASWEPTIQLLRYANGGEMLRLCVYHGNRFTRMPPLLTKNELRALSKRVSENPGILRLLREILPRK